MEIKKLKLQSPPKDPEKKNVGTSVSDDYTQSQLSIMTSQTENIKNEHLN